MTNEPIETIDEVVLQDLDAVQEQKQVLPVANGVRVKIKKATVRKSLEDNSKDAVEGPENRWAYKYLNVSFTIVDGISVPILDDNGNPTGESEIKYKNKILFSNRMDFVFTHNPDVKTTQWWKDKQYIFGFRSLAKALGFELKELKINDAFLAEIEGKELLIDIGQEEEQEKKDGEWVGKGTFRNVIRNLRAWA